MSAVKPPPKKPNGMDLVGGKYSVISLGVGADFLLPTPAAMKVIEQMRSAVPVDRVYGARSQGNHYKPTAMIGRFELTVLSKGDSIGPEQESRDADQA